MSKNVIEFLEQSNWIEGVYDLEALEQAVEAWKYLVKQKELTAGVILKTHKILMLKEPLLPNERGYFRKVQVMVGGKEKMRWESGPLAIDELCDRIKHISDFPYKKKDLEEMSKSLHIQYENIHPFVDGNGRTGRMFMNWWRLQRDLPILVIKESEKQDYYKWFSST